MKHILVLLMMLCALPAFAGDEALSGSTSASGGGVVVGTLADANDPFDMAIAPQYTRVIFVRLSTAAALRAVANKGCASNSCLESVVEKAKAVQAKADAARTALDQLQKQIKQAKELVAHADSAYADFMETVQ